MMIPAVGGRRVAPRSPMAFLYAMATLAIAVLSSACSQPAPAEAPGPVVDATWLADHLDQVVVVDIRDDAAEGAEPSGYSTGHIPGAVHAPYRATPWRVTRDDVGGMMPSLSEMEELVGGLGLTNEDHVVVASAGSSAGDMATATRVYWQLKVIGHDRLSILDGGYAAWTSAGLPTETKPIEPTPTEYSGRLRSELVAGVAEVEEAVAGRGALLDARTADFHAGERKSSSVARPGTLPGARNTPLTALFSETTGRFVSAEEARAVWEGAGVDMAGAQIAFCNSGQQASLAWFVSSEVLGNEDVRLYDGSLMEWAADEARPMQTTNPGGP